MPGLQLAAHIDEQGLAWCHIADQFVAIALQRDAFARHHELALGGLAKAQRADTERIAKSHQAMARDQRYHRITALDALLHRANRLEDLLGGQRQITCRLIEFMRQHIQQDFRIALGVDMAAVDVKQLLL